MADPNDPLERLGPVAEKVIERTEWEQKNRIGLLRIHAGIGLLAGAQMWLWGSASTIENSIGVWTRVVLAVLGTVGGLFLAFGLRARPRSIPLEIIGLALIGVWDALMTAGLAWGRFHQHDFHIVPITQPLGVGYVVAYPTTVYGGLFLMICVHLSTLRRKRKVS